MSSIDVCILRAINVRSFYFVFKIFSKCCVIKNVEWDETRLSEGEKNA